MQLNLAQKDICISHDTCGAVSECGTQVKPHKSLSHKSVPFFGFCEKHHPVRVAKTFSTREAFFYMEQILDCY